MDRRERYRNEEELQRLAFGAFQSRLWTALPGIVERFDAAKMIVDVQPTINGRARSKDGTVTSLQMPLLLDCPVLWQGGGGAIFTYPIEQGDECLVVFASRCIDAWFASGGVQDPPEFRMHNLSDGFALVGVRSQPNAFEVSTSEAVLRNDAGDAFMKFNPTAKTLAITMSGGVTINGVTIDASGNVGSPATVTATTDVVGGGKHLKTHTHGGVTTGAGTSGAPT
jgi:hypothetical protein